MSLVIALHAVGAALALLLGAANLIRPTRGDQLHRRIGRVWVVAMYGTVVSSFWIRELNPGGFSWLHGLAAWTFISLTIGLWAAVTGRIQLHRGFMRGTYIGTVAAFVGAVVVPQRDIPQLLVHHTMLLSAAALGVTAAATAIVMASRPRTAPQAVAVP